MNSFTIQKTVCRQCCAVLDVADRYCRYCGAPTALAGDPSTMRPVVATVVSGHAADVPNRTESPWVVLPALFLVLGPLGLPMLWRSRQFSLVWKCLLTAIMIGVTAVLAWGIWLVMHQTMASLNQLDVIRGL